MRRSTLLAVVVAVAAITGLAFASAERIGDKGAAPGASTPAKPQVVRLDWREVEGQKGERLVFAVHSFQVLTNGWRARISVSNRSQVAFGLDKAKRSFGLMLFSSGNHADLVRRVNERSLPTLRAALGYAPALPNALDPKETWTGTISASGALVAGGWVRFVYGTFDAIGRTPDNLTDHLVWITDHAYRLRG